jgi:hypothetical protein
MGAMYVTWHGRVKGIFNVTESYDISAPKHTTENAFNN